MITFFVLIQCIIAENFVYVTALHYKDENFLILYAKKKNIKKVELPGP